VSRRHQTFRQRDLTKAVKALIAAGKSVAEILVDKAGAHIVVSPDQGKTQDAANTGTNSWDTL